MSKKQSQQSRVAEIPFPVKGLSELYPYSQQPEGTTSGCLNVRARDTLQKRIRGGRRAGSSKWITDQINSGATIQDINSVQWPYTDSTAGLSEEEVLIENAINLRGISATVTSDGYLVTTFINRQSYTIEMVIYDSEGTNILPSTTLYSSTSSGVQSSSTACVGLSDGNIMVFFNIKQASPYPKYGYYMIVDQEGTVVKAAATFKEQNVDTIAAVLLANNNVMMAFNTGTVPTALDASYINIYDSDGELVETEVQFGPESGYAYTFYNMTLLDNDNVVLSYTANGSVFKFEIFDGTDGTNVHVSDDIESAYTISWTTKLSNGNFAIAYSSSKGYISVWDEDGGAVLAATEITDPDPDMIACASSGNNIHVYYHLTAGETTYTAVYSQTGSVVTEPTIINVNYTQRFSTGQINDYSHFVVYQDDDDDEMCMHRYIYDISYLIARAVTIVSEGSVYYYKDGNAAVLATGGEGIFEQSVTLSNGNRPYSTPAFAKMYLVDGNNSLVYDPSDDTVTAWVTEDYTADDEVEGLGIEGESKGTVPPGCKLIALYRGRVVLASDFDNPHNWFASKLGNPHDFDYDPAVTNLTQAVAGNNSSLGEIGDIINTLIPYSDDIMLFGCDHSIWSLTGDPAAGGVIDMISNKAGISFGKSWAYDPYGVLYFHSRDGIYRMMRGGMPELISVNIPKQIEEIDLEAYNVQLEWDLNQDGLCVLVIKKDYSAVSKFIFFEHDTQAWWLDDFPDAMGPSCLFWFDSNAPSDASMLLGCMDGYVRQIDDTAETDDGTAIASYIEYQPIIQSGPYGNTIVTEILPIVGKSSANITLKLYSANTPEELDAASSVLLTKTLSAGRNAPIIQRIANNAVKIAIDNSSGNRWAMENMLVSRRTMGKIRRH